MAAKKTKKAKKPARKPRKPRKRTQAAPAKPVNNGNHDPATGHFVAGNCANPAGRPRGIDFRRLVREKTKDNGSVEDALFAVYKALTVMARAGDVPAAKLLLDRLCDKDPDKAPDDDDRLTHEERLRRLLILLGLHGQEAT